MADTDGADVPGLAGDAALWQGRYEAFVRLYKGRGDIIAEMKDGGYVPAQGAGLTFERFMDHVRLRKTYALYNLDARQRVSFGLFDVDVRDRSAGWAKILPALEEKRRETSLIVSTLIAMGLERKNILIEFPTVGFHVLIFFRDPVPAKALKAVMQDVLKRCNLTHIPFYPRNVENSLDGDRIQLPLRINLNTGKRSNFVRDLDTFDPEQYDEGPNFTVLEEITPIDPQWVSRWVG